MKESKYTAEEIANYINQFAEMKEQGTRDTINIYTSESGLTHTRGSMEYRDNKHKHIVTVDLLNEYAPYSKSDIKSIVEYKLNN